jgi:hypothetical protein
MKFRKSINTPYVPANVLGLRQEGGQMVQGTPANMQEGGEDPMQQIMMAAQQAVEENNAELALQVCAALVQMVMGASEQEQAPAEGAPMEEAPMEEEMPM